ncbi:ribonuclease E [Meinhardsimonia xiamenensis]|jgi:ribonuclease E|uniref:Ribonuclease E n=1 Tax=Meinhardsimonia xiamenensis TaxID=990712 RepID=A0A1G9BKH0_9RHOB|nr:ribonuclease E/G [Meinhardsimonia xiamenensis]PRX34943.1 RNAse E [Meinhardsimonia xiamenensis]SDK40018.1 ribonuclease E [Meinhardsimonia xiamenensis]
MAKKMLIDATHAEETRVVVVDGNRVEEFDFESENRRQIAGNIYLAKVTRVEPSLQAAFVDYGGNRHGFLAFSEIHPDYYQIPVADRKALLEEEERLAEAEEDEAEEKPRARRSRSRSRSRSRAKKVEAGQDAVETAELASAEIPGMEVLDTEEEGEADAPQPDDGLAEEGEAKPYVAAEHAAETDPEVESVAEEDVQEEIRQPRRVRPRRYKIQEVIKVRQIMLVQVVKEERGNKGAALTTYLSLPGRYCVLMPNTARGGGISRKITNAADRKRLKQIAAELDVPKGAGLIIRTAGAKRTKAEIKRDYEYLKRLWEQIRELTLKSRAPAKIYEEGDLIKRAIRDLYSREIEEVLVEGEKGYRTAKDFMKMIMPSHAKNVKLYDDPMPLFARYGVESYLASMFNPVVQLPSGGYIVIGVTEALVAIDVNSGRATKKGSIEETALQTNLEAAEEIARQLRLRDLAGLIVIDFIDMEERKNNAAVEKRFKEKLKTDRARIQVGRISAFGLLEMSRQRLRPGMLEASTQPCPACHGTGLIRSDDSLALSILRQIEEEGVRRRSAEVLIKAPVAIVNYLVNNKREHIARIEERYGLAVRIEADPFLIPPEFSMEKFKTSTRALPEPQKPVVSVDASLMPELEEAETVDSEAGQDAQQAQQGGKKKRRRRRRKRGGGGEAQAAEAQVTEAQESEAGKDEAAEAEVAEAAQGEAEKPAEEAVIAAAPEAEAQAPAEEAEEKPKRKRTRSRRKKAELEQPETGEAVEPASEAVATEAVAEVAAAETEAEAKGEAPAADAPEVPAAEKPKRRRARSRKSKAEAAETAEPVEASAAPEEESESSQPVEEAAAPAPADAEAQVAAVATEAPEPAAPAAAAAAAEKAQDRVEAVAERAESEAPTAEPATVQPVAAGDVAEEAPPSAPEAEKRPRRRGWWSLGGR